MWKVEKYYTAMEYFCKRFETIGRKIGLKALNKEEYVIWKSEVRTILKRLTGLDTMLKADLNPEIVEETRPDSYYIRQKIIIRTEPSVYMPFYMLKPTEMKKGEIRPVVIAPHGHGNSGGKLATCGRNDIPEIKNTIEEYNYDYAVQYVKQGFIVFAPDARGFGERRESYSQGDDPEIAFGKSCTQLSNMAIPLGQTVAGMWTWDLMRLIDYIQTRDDCNPEKIGCAGLSGGGLQTLWLSALDERIKACVISGYMYGYLESLLIMSNNCSCNYVPHLWEYVDMGDIGALIAPRPILIETGDIDHLNGESGLNNVIPQVKIIKHAYNLYNMEDRVFHDIFKGEHRWHGKYAIDWMKKWLS